MFLYFPQGAYPHRYSCNWQHRLSKVSFLIQGLSYLKQTKHTVAEFPSSPMIRTWCPQCCGPGFDPTHCKAQPKKKNPIVASNDINRGLTEAQAVYPVLWVVLEEVRPWETCPYRDITFALLEPLSTNLDLALSHQPSQRLQMNPQMQWFS